MIGELYQFGWHDTFDVWEAAGRPTLLEEVVREQVRQILATVRCCLSMRMSRGNSTASRNALKWRLDVAEHIRFRVLLFGPAGRKGRRT